MCKPFRKCLKSWVTALSVILILCIAVGGTVALLIARTEPLENRFEEAVVICQVNRNGDVFNVKNIGNIDVYIRAAIVVNWMDKNGNIYGIAPTQENVTISVNDSGWRIMDDGYAYYLERVAPGESTQDLINAITLLSDGPEGYWLSVEVVAEAIQADGVDSDSNWPAILDAWGSGLRNQGG